MDGGAKSVAGIGWRCGWLGGAVDIEPIIRQTGGVRHAFLLGGWAPACSCSASIGANSQTERLNLLSVDVQQQASDEGGTNKVAYR